MATAVVEGLACPDGTIELHQDDASDSQNATSSSDTNSHASSYSCSANSGGGPDSSSTTTTNYKHTNESESETTSQEQEYKCSAVHTLERDMPDYDYSHLIEQLRGLMLEDCKQNVGMFAQPDIDKCATDDWHLSRFLLRNKMDVAAAHEMLRNSMRFNHESMASMLRPEEFPAEFYQVGGLFCYEPDRKGNKMLYMRIKKHKKTPEIFMGIQAFIFSHIKRLDDEAGGKGISIVFDCSGAGIANADMDSLLFIINTLKAYFPKGLSYFLVHELPWILKPFWFIAKAWVPEDYRQMIKFSDSNTIFEYVDRENLPDFMGGTCTRPYNKVPDNCVTIEQAAKLWGIERKVVGNVVRKFAVDLPEETVARVQCWVDKEDEQTNNEDEPELRPAGEFDWPGFGAVARS